MNIVLLSGGSGKRLVPLTSEDRPKQFLEILPCENGGYQSMAQRVFSQIKDECSDANVVFAANKKHVKQIHEQIGEVPISVEPSMRDTFGAIALACAYLHDEQKYAEDEVIVFCPCDVYAEDTFFKDLLELYKLSDSFGHGISLMGINPTYAAESYGYIVPENCQRISKVNKFIEKPDVENASRLIESGALWNCGVFAFKLGYMLNRAHELTNFDNYADLLNNYEAVPKTSFDYAVLEHEQNIQVLRHEDLWSDLGTWGSLLKVADKQKIDEIVNS